MDEGGEEGIYCGDHFVVYMNIELLCCIDRTNIVLYTSVISIKTFLMVGSRPAMKESKETNNKIKITCILATNSF